MPEQTHDAKYWGYQAAHVVAVIHDGKTEYWVAATRRHDASAAVRKCVAKGAEIKLVNKFLTTQQRAALRLAPGEARRLPDGIEFSV